MENFITLLWWYSISIYSFYNLKYLYDYRIHITHDTLWMYQSSCIFIIACSARSIFPRIDVERICFYDNWISYPLVGRTLATFGEIAFGYQLTLITKIFACKLNCYKIYNLMNIVMSLIIIAQFFCWNGVLFQKDFMHVIEESIWAFSMATIGTIVI